MDEGEICFGAELGEELSALRCGVEGVKVLEVCRCEGWEIRTVVGAEEGKIAGQYGGTAGGCCGWVVLGKLVGPEDGLGEAVVWVFGNELDFGWRNVLESMKLEVGDVDAGSQFYGT